MNLEELSSAGPGAYEPALCWAGPQDAWGTLHFSSLKFPQIQSCKWLSEVNVQSIFVKGPMFEYLLPDKEQGFLFVSVSKVGSENQTQALMLVRQALY